MHYRIAMAVNYHGSDQTFQVRCSELVDGVPVTHYEELTSNMVACAGVQGTAWDLFCSHNKERFHQLTLRHQKNLKDCSNYKYAVLCKAALFAVCEPLLTTNITTLVFEYTDFLEIR